MTEIQQAALDHSGDSRDMEFHSDYQEMMNEPSNAMYFGMGKQRDARIDGFFRGARWMEEKMKLKSDEIWEIARAAERDNENEQLARDNQINRAKAKRDDRWCQFAAAAVSGWVASMEHCRSDSNISDSMAAEASATVADAMLAEMEKRGIK